MGASLLRAYQKKIKKYCTLPHKEIEVIGTTAAPIVLPISHDALVCTTPYVIVVAHPHTVAIIDIHIVIYLFIYLHLPNTLLVLASRTICN